MASSKMDEETLHTHTNTCITNTDTFMHTQITYMGMHTHAAQRLVNTQAHPQTYTHATHTDIHIQHTHIGRYTHAQHTHKTLIKHTHVQIHTYRERKHSYTEGIRMIEGILLAGLKAKTE